MPGQAPRTSIPARRSAPPRVRAPSSRSPPPQSLEREARTHPTSVRSPETPPFAVPFSARRAHDQIPPWPGDPRARPREHLDALPFSYRLLCSARPSTRLRLRQTACDGPAGPPVLSRSISHLTSPSSLPDANARVRDDTSVAPGASIAIHAISRRFLFAELGKPAVMRAFVPARISPRCRLVFLHTLPQSRSAIPRPDIGRCSFRGQHARLQHSGCSL
ncbi:hypothetical protein BD311DRAFT_539128 [Dichomitus squalens]|uniref:Uncharacterized protein n=1 Tax=Dichomitus squalens TaxID=114155 RepID=A0A4Q9MBT9_9APHY|nr:hypothetical protein BD311DRAFT_539128 [Dichomitus squalens]